jgi:hypothetical protein
LQGGISNPNDYRMKNAAPITIELTPAMEAARLFSASFWDNPDIPRKSDNYCKWNICIYCSSIFPME